jgi:hypothetical protein
MQRKGIYGDIYTRQIYIGSEELPNKLLTRKEIVALIGSVQYDNQTNIANLALKAADLLNLADQKTNLIGLAGEKSSIDSLLANYNSGKVGENITYTLTSAPNGAATTIKLLGKRDGQLIQAATSSVDVSINVKLTDITA